MVVHRNWASGKTSTAVTVNTAVPLVRSMCKMECNNVLDANVMVNTCSGTTTKGTECQICLLLAPTSNTKNETYQPVYGRKRKAVQNDGKVRPSGVVDVVRVWCGGVAGVGKWEGEKKWVSGAPGSFVLVCGGVKTKTVCYLS